MKNMNIIFALLLAFTFSLGGCAQTTGGNNTSTDTSSNVSVYYFHFNARCATCRAIESEAKTAVEELANDNIGFASYNLDEKAGAARGKKVGASGQTLLIIKGDDKIDLTREGFLYARTNPEKFRQIVADNIKSLL